MATSPNLTVSATPPATAPPAAAGTPAAAATPDPAALQKKIDELTASEAEAKRSAEFWHGKATASAPAPKPAAAAEPEDDTDILEVLTTKGAKGLDEVLAKRGFVRAADVDKRVDAKAAALTTQQKLYDEYPDLRKPDSDFFKATALEYGDLVRKGVAETVAMEMAAGATELKFMRDGKIKTPAETKAEKERDRRARAAAAGGDDNRRGTAAEEGDEELTPQQKQIAASMGISEEAYAKRAKAGVSMKGIR